VAWDEAYTVSWCCSIPRLPHFDVPEKNIEVVQAWGACHVNTVKGGKGVERP